LTSELIKDEGAGPLLFVEIPGSAADSKTVLMYAHMDKQPPMDGWEEGLGPHEPVVRDGKLYGRGSSDDGYGIFAGITMIKTLQQFN
jgi:acetylornithine deacetylase/succinyl-diaminopimelate desuccinylase-like protein